MSAKEGKFSSDNQTLAPDAGTDPFGAWPGVVLVQTLLHPTNGLELFDPTHPRMLVGLSARLAHDCREEGDDLDSFSETGWCMA